MDPSGDKSQSDATHSASGFDTRPPKSIWSNLRFTVVLGAATLVVGALTIIGLNSLAHKISGSLAAALAGPALIFLALICIVCGLAIGRRTARREFQILMSFAFGVSIAIGTIVTLFCRFPTWLNASQISGSMPFIVVLAGCILGYITFVITFHFSAMSDPKHAAPPGFCTKCGYNLTGNVTGRCPECGSQVAP